jgi:hypothetical protein
MLCFSSSSMLPVFLDRLFLIDPMVFSNVYLWFQNLWSPYFIYCLLWYFMKSYILLLYCFLYLLTFIWIIFKRVHCLVYINVNELGYYCWTDILFLFGMYHITNMEDIPFFNGKSAYRSYMNQAVYCTMIIDYFLFWLYLLRI